MVKVSEGCRKKTKQNASNQVNLLCFFRRQSNKSIVVPIFNLYTFAIDRFEKLESNHSVIFTFNIYHMFL